MVRRNQPWTLRRLVLHGAAGGAVIAMALYMLRGPRPEGDTMGLIALLVGCALGGAAWVALIYGLYRIFTR